VAIVDGDLRVFEKQVVTTANLVENIADLLTRFPVTVIVLGDRTNSKKICKQLQSFCRKIVMVNEDKSSLEGRYRYLKENTTGVWRLLPIGLRTPDRPFDDYVAVVLAERFLKNQISATNTIENNR
jgi:hypothetical protein